MLLIALPLLIASAPQAVRVIYPDPAVVAAARLPVPDVVMTRAQADALSDAELTRRLIGHVARGPITRVRRQAVVATPMSQETNALSWAVFAEAGTPWRGRLCRGRDISVTFSGPDAPAGEPTIAAENRPRRVFAVTQYRTVAVLPAAASGAGCARAGMARVPPGHVDEAVGLIERLLAVGGRKDTGLMLRSCFDRYASGSTACDARATLGSLDWSQLRLVSRTGFTGEPVRWTMTVGPGERSWDVVVEESGAGPVVSLRRDYPVPF